MARMITAAVGHHKKTSIIVAVLLLAGAAGGWIIAPASMNAAVEELTAHEWTARAARKFCRPTRSRPASSAPMWRLAPTLTARPMSATRRWPLRWRRQARWRLVEWDGGRNVGIGHVTGNVLLLSRPGAG